MRAAVEEAQFLFSVLVLIDLGCPTQPTNVPDNSWAAVPGFSKSPFSTILSVELWRISFTLSMMIPVEPLTPMIERTFGPYTTLILVVK